MIPISGFLNTFNDFRIHYFKKRQQINKTAKTGVFFCARAMRLHMKRMLIVPFFIFNNKNVLFFVSRIACRQSRLGDRRWDPGSQWEIAGRCHPHRSHISHSSGKFCNLKKKNCHLYGACWEMVAYHGCIINTGIGTCRIAAAIINLIIFYLKNCHLYGACWEMVAYHGCTCRIAAAIIKNNHRKGDRQSGSLEEHIEGPCQDHVWTGAVIVSHRLPLRVAAADDVRPSFVYYFGRVLYIIGARWFGLGDWCLKRAGTRLVN